MSNIDKRAQMELYAKVEQQAHELRGNPIAYQVVTGMCPVNVIEMHAQKVQALLDELEAKDKQIAELSSLQGKPIAWESTTPVYVKFITDEHYQRLRLGYKKWYKPYRCSQCAAAGKGEAS
ncbi:TPA: hypothetical protein ACHS9P_000492 [Enterobacter roggenkampii]